MAARVPSLIAAFAFAALLVFAAAFTIFVPGAPAQGGAQGEAQSPILSPPAKAECKFPDGKAVHVDYSSPRMRGRKIFGGLVPYGEPWRAGANSATTFVIDTDTVVGGKAVPAGSYTLFTLPNVDHWLLIVSKQTGEWGIPYPGDAYDFARIPMTLGKLSAPLENFTISFDQRGGACTMNLSWDTTRASIRISEKK
jgi:hypothetical protein